MAIAQAYGDIPWEHRHWKERGINLNLQKDGTLKGIVELAGWDNKMFVRADAMPHRIRITNIKVERLQDITEEDILREGVMQEGVGFYVHGTHDIIGMDARNVFSILINKVSGKGTWERNPFVFAYTFELVK